MNKKSEWIYWILTFKIHHISLTDLKLGVRPTKTRMNSKHLSSSGIIERGSLGLHKHLTLLGRVSSETMPISFYGNLCLSCGTTSSKRLSSLSRSYMCRSCHIFVFPAFLCVLAVGGFCIRLFTESTSPGLCNYWSNERFIPLCLCFLSQKRLQNRC